MTKELMLKELRDIVNRYEIVMSYAQIANITYYGWLEHADDHEELKKIYSFMFMGSKKSFILYLQAAQQVYDMYKKEINWEVMMTLSKSQKEVVLFLETLRDIKLKWQNRPLKRKRRSE